jgi:hypothetical protein
MYFLLNDVILTLDLQTTSPPMEARRISSLSLDCVQRLGRELFAEEPRLQHRSAERARRLATLIVSKSPEVNAALFVAPDRDCPPDDVAVRLASLDLMLMAQLYRDQQTGRLTPTMADQRVWAVVAA